MMVMQRKDVQEMGFGQVEDQLAKVTLSIINLNQSPITQKNNRLVHFSKAYVKVEFS